MAAAMMYEMPVPVRFDNWRHYRGISLNTGQSALVPSRMAELRPETDTWTLHRSFELKQSPDDDYAPPGMQGMPVIPYPNMMRGSNNSLNHYAMRQRANVGPPRVAFSPEPLRLLVARHGERLDFLMGANWIEQCFDRKGNYVRKTLTMPKWLPQRKDPIHTYPMDTPLTEMGKFQAALTGKELLDAGYPIRYAYASPALRCIQTASEILRGMDLFHEVPIRIESGLFEYLGWYPGGPPVFMRFDELTNAGFNIERSYRPVLHTSKFNPKEGIHDYYERSHLVTSEIVKRHEREGGNILMIGHAATPETCTRQLLGYPPRSIPDFSSVIRQVNYLTLAVVERSAWGKWDMRPNPIPPLLPADKPFEPKPIPQPVVPLIQ